MNPATRTFALLFLILCLGWYCERTVVDVIRVLALPSDFEQYYEAAGEVIAGRSPFTAKGYIYPPLLALLLTPIAHLSYLTDRWIWFLLSQGCLVGAAWLMWRAMKKDWLAACAIAFVWAMGGAASESLALGQIGPQLVLLLAVAYTQSAALQVSAAALGLALKVIPGILGVVLVLRRQWRAVVAFAAASLILLILPWGFVICCLDGPSTPAGHDTWSGTPATLSWGLPSVALRILDPPSTGNSLPRDWETGNDLPNLHLRAPRRFLSLGVAFSTIVGGIIILAVVFKDGLSSSQVPFVFAALVALSLAASPVCWSHYQLMQYPGVALMVGYAVRSRRWCLLVCVLLVSALLYPLPVALLGRYYHAYGRWTAASPATLYCWTSVPSLASLALFDLLLQAARRQADHSAGSNRLGGA